MTKKQELVQRLYDSGNGVISFEEMTLLLGKEKIMHPALQQTREIHHHHYERLTPALFRKPFEITCQTLSLPKRNDIYATS